MRGLQERGAVAPLTGTRRTLAIAAAVAAPVVALDQLAKAWAVHRLSDGAIHLFWTLDLRLTFNSGAAFSLGPGLTPFLTVIGVVLVGVLVLMSRSVSRTSAAIALGLLLGGALGNLTDRLFRDLGGKVVDFIDFGWWPVFNLADTALFCGAILLVLTNLRGDES
ncbi:MAG: signal peptidase [Actinomycetota bacterium]